MNKTEDELFKDLERIKDKFNRNLLFSSAVKIAGIPDQLEELTELINRYLKPLYTNRSVGILWDVENVLPSSKSSVSCPHLTLG